MSQGEASVSSVGTAIRVTWQAAWMEFDRFNEHGDDLSAETTCYSLLPPRQGLLHRARFNLLSTTTRSSIAKTLSGRESGLPWSEMLESAVWLAIEAYREGDPTVDLRTVDPWPQDRWLLRPYVEYGGPTVLFAEGGSKKSILALWMALRVALAGKPVLYLDYESGKELHAQRMRALCAGMKIDPEAMPPVHYKRGSSSLSQSLYVVRRDIDLFQCGMVVIDSVGMAGDGPPEEAATAVGLFRSIRTIPVPCLCIHHKRKAAAGQKAENQRDRMFGSVYYVNFARLAWEVDAPEDEESANPVVGLVNVKSNNGRLEKRHALEIAFTNETANGSERLTCLTINAVDIRTVPELSGRVTLAERISAELRHGPMSAKELAVSLDSSPNSVGVTLSRMKASSVVLRVDDNRWGLLARES